MDTSAAKINLLNLDRRALEAFFVDIGEKAFRASQVMKWVHQYRVDDFEQMTNLSKALREKLAQRAEIRTPEIVVEQNSQDGTRKWLLRLDDGNCIETVFIPEDGRGTLCVSSQVGCALDCSFCSTAKQGFNRNLTTAEIISQVWIAKRTLEPDAHPDNRAVTNIVLMGMGEPLLNYDNVVAAMNLMLDDYAYGLSKRRVTLSTAGVIPALDRLSEECDVSLAISLHACNDALRDELVPINRKYPLSELIAACRRYAGKEGRRKITIEYVMLKGVNDSIADAKAMVKLLKGIPSKINLIPFNPFPQSRYERSDQQTIDKFRDVLWAAGLTTVTRRTRGDDIDAACGQLAGKVADRTKRRFRNIPIEASA